MPWENIPIITLQSNIVPVSWPCFFLLKSKQVPISNFHGITLLLTFLGTFLTKPGEYSRALSQPVTHSVLCTAETRSSESHRLTHCCKMGKSSKNHTRSDLLPKAGYSEKRRNGPIQKEDFLSPNFVPTHMHPIVQE